MARHEDLRDDGLPLNEKGATQVTLVQQSGFMGKSIFDDANDTGDQRIRLIKKYNKGRETMPNFHETSGSREHTPDAALVDAMKWLGRTPSSMADVILMTLPGRLRREQERTLYDELSRVLNPDTGSLFVWGSSAGLAGAGLEYQVITSDLVHAWSAWDRPALSSDVHLPSFGSLAREFPPSLIEYCLRATGSAPGRLSVDIFPRAPHIAQSVAREVGAQVLSVGAVADLYTADHTAPAFVRSNAFADEFWKCLVKQGNCLIYPGKPHVASGYARLKIGGIEYYAHRVAWMLSHRRGIPDEIPVLHSSCQDRRCCTPGHLRLGTTLINLDERWIGRRRQA